MLEEKEREFREEKLEMTWKKEDGEHRAALTRTMRRSERTRETKE